MMVTLHYESIFGSELLEVCVFLKLFGLCIGVVLMVSSGEYSDGWHFGKEEWIYFVVCNLCVGLLDK
jgi:hypothetical protein